ncbi:hypothetical protein ACMXYW_10580 [Neptuniibacter sp. QD48_55]|uniref:hypothetical protein n=1 Tax=Neptuniibacter sp. QD48_55 TaxID=3398212 RepID=UPI0039F4484F
MATLPTPEESGELILKIYEEFGVRPGEMLQMRSLLAKWIHTDLRNSDLADGLQWLGERGFIEQKEGKSSDVFFLTEAGFAAI